MVRIRLSRMGKKHVPFYRVVAIDGRAKRDGSALEILGTYDPKLKTLVRFHPERVDFWLSKGAVPSETVKKLHRDYKKTAGAQ